MMLSIFSEHTLVNYTFLKDFYVHEVAVECAQTDSNPGVTATRCNRHPL